MPDPPGELWTYLVGWDGGDEHLAGDGPLERDSPEHPAERRSLFGGTGESGLQALLGGGVRQGDVGRFGEQRVGAGAGDVGCQELVRLVVLLCQVADGATPPDACESAHNTATMLRRPVVRQGGVATARWMLVRAAGSPVQ